ncbi:MAG: hypothetical protein HYZ14_16205 [Bacteroidetes bacterium]|nr:hypothetical protein [Bacteroidota bacterium]
MTVNFKKAAAILVAVISLGSVNAQTDSTDLNFYAGTFTPLTQEDSLTYGTSVSEGLYLAFDLVDTTITKIRIEVLITDAESNMISVMNTTYTLDELNSLNLITGTQVELTLGAARPGYPHQLYITLLDEQGHEKRTITKYLAE